MSSDKTYKLHYLSARTYNDRRITSCGLPVDRHYRPKRYEENFKTFLNAGTCQSCLASMERVRLYLAKETDVQPAALCYWYTEEASEEGRAAISSLQSSQGVPVQRTNDHE